MVDELAPVGVDRRDDRVVAVDRGIFQHRRAERLEGGHHGRRIVLRQPARRVLSFRPEHVVERRRRLRRRGHERQILNAGDFGATRRSVAHHVSAVANFNSHRCNPSIEVTFGPDGRGSVCEPQLNHRSIVMRTGEPDGEPVHTPASNNRHPLSRARGHQAVAVVGATVGAAVPAVVGPGGKLPVGRGGCPDWYLECRRGRGAARARQSAHRRSRRCRQPWRDLLRRGAAAGAADRISGGAPGALGFPRCRPIA